MLKNSSPKYVVSVVLPAFNAAAFLPEAVQSILDQKFTSWELLIVVDDSKDETLAIAHRFALLDERIFVLKNRFKGISGALNTGLLAARGEFIARMDADDISLDFRLEAQIEFLRRSPNVLALGCAFEVFNNSGPRLTVRHPTNPIFASFSQCADSIIGHPTVMMRKNAVLRSGGYFECQVAEDFGLFTRLAKHGEVVSLPMIGLRYREHGANLSVVKAEAVQKSAVEIGKGHYREIMNTVRWYDIVRTLTLNPKSLSRFQRVKAATVALVFVFRTSRRYGYSLFSRVTHQAVREVILLFAGRRFHDA